jgi:hypothetical protein
MRAEVEGRPTSDSVRHTHLCSLEWDNLNAHGVEGGTINAYAIEHAIPILRIGT